MSSEAETTREISSDSSDSGREVVISPLAPCPLHELPDRRRELGLEHRRRPRSRPDPRYVGWADLPRLSAQAAPRPAAPRRGEQQNAARESSEERPARASPRPRPMARRGRPAPAAAPPRVATPPREPEPRPRKKPRRVPLRPPSSSPESEPDSAPRNVARRRRVEPVQRAPPPPPSGPPLPRSAIPLSPKQRLQRDWQAKCRAAGAAPVVVGEPGDEAVPELVDGFRWIETGYDLGEGFSQEKFEDFLVSCDCGDICEDAEACACQQELRGEDGQGPESCAYDANGLFKFDRDWGSLIIECHKRCSCRPTCPSRVAQRPRDVKIQIFKTRYCGWGVKALYDLPKGKVLGLYTGKLITRAEAAEARDPNRSYIFDLDARETDQDVQEDMKYSVDAYKQGNWTRFVNHSCESNLEVVSVFWDIPASSNRPYLAFVAKEDIPKGTELTIDYDPKAARDKKGKRRQAGGKECNCGAKHCRRRIPV
ncbi:hypothetical protein PsYK624_039790 [Phanerochaete sordida]|uniref:SET domain-containing protein n=1 Tax=Phanerochaete sordida TaxID=48140 RepID=A0A9P3LA81_9APHY|nr:hypothetical protein PsYK624_039790 [Phanerochaete sordida]